MPVVMFWANFVCTRRGKHRCFHAGLFWNGRTLLIAEHTGSALGPEYIHWPVLKRRGSVGLVIDESETEILVGVHEEFKH